jgi:hypothetical protein
MNKLECFMQPTGICFEAVTASDHVTMRHFEPAGTTNPSWVLLLAPIMNTLVNVIRRGYELVVAGGQALQAPFLLALRLYFFWQLFLTGKGKLGNIGKVSEFFTSLGIPLPTLNAYFIGPLECFGSLLLSSAWHRDLCRF